MDAERLWWEEAEAEAEEEEEEEELEVLGESGEEAAEQEGDDAEKDEGEQKASDTLLQELWKHCREDGGDGEGRR